MFARFKPKGSVQAFTLPLCAAVLACPLEAKRAAPKPVPPVESGGRLYTALLDDGRRGYLVAVDARTQQPLWSCTLFRNRIDPHLETDVQMVYIQALTLEGESLVATDERGGAYRLDLSTRKVTRLARRPQGLQPRVPKPGGEGR
jgi:hypothetical protein